MVTPCRPAGSGAGLELGSRMADGWAGAGWAGCAHAAATARMARIATRGSGMKSGSWRTRADLEVCPTVLGQLCGIGLLACLTVNSNFIWFFQRARRANPVARSNPSPAQPVSAQFLYPDRSRHTDAEFYPRRRAYPAYPAQDEAAVEGLAGASGHSQEPPATAAGPTPPHGSLDTQTCPTNQTRRRRSGPPSTTRTSSEPGHSRPPAHDGHADCAAHRPSGRYSRPCSRASSRCGSPSGISGRSSSCHKNAASQIPPSPMGSRKSIQPPVNCALMKSGATIQYRSTKRITMTTTATARSSLKLRLRSRESSSAKGNANCSSTSATPMYCHPPAKRFTYHGISSGRLPDQITNNCENEKYAHTITKASSSLPTACRWRCVRTSESGGRLLRITSRQMRNATADRPSPAIKSKPKIVENQCGLIDRIQSMAMKVTLNP